MAESAPISDVLCGAMEYLLKLGTNLRQRSEVLKEKRIRKDKLRNSHAVKKAASKVLLLCELSKKSIDNVESSVKNIMSQIKTMQLNSFSGKVSSSENVSLYEYFNFNSKKLKVRSKINIKHYTSVKVRATAMPVSLQDKYPVYYDCPLFRIRKKVSMLQLTENLNNSESDETDVFLSKYDKNVQRTKKKHKISDQKDGDISNLSTNMEHTIENVGIHKIDNPSNTDRKQNNCEMEVQSKDIRKMKRFKHIKQLDDSSSDGLEYSINKLKESIEPAKTKAIVKSILESDSLCDKDKNKKSISERDSDSNSDTEKTKNCVEKQKTHKDSNRREDKENVILTESNDLLKKNNVSPAVENNETKLQKSASEDEDNTKETKEKCREVNNYESDKSADSDTSKQSFIKCVNINKLLRPDKIEINSAAKPKGKYFEKEKRKHNENKSTSFKSDSRKYTKRVTFDDDIFLKKKQEEIKLFKPKSFTINITRLPKITVSFLKKQNLRKIIQNEAVVCEASDEQSHCKEQNNSDSNKFTKSETTEKSSKGCIDVNLAKNALLDASDSEKSEVEEEVTKSITKSNEIIAQCHNRDQQSPEDEVTKSNKENDEVTAQCQERDQQSPEDEVTKSYKENDEVTTQCQERDQQSPEDEVTKSNKEHNEDITQCQEIDQKTPEKTSPLNDVQDKIKSSLLNTSDENSQTPTHKTRDKTPPSKRKRIMESMRAKKMLLTYSSSDTEDEQLSNALKKIKYALLNGGSSSYDEFMDEKNTSKSDKRTLERENSHDSLSSSERRFQDDEVKVTNKDPANTEDTNSSSIKMGRPNTKTSSGSRESDSQDSDKDIKGLTNLKSLKNYRTRRRAARRRSERTIKKKMANVPGFSEDVLLQPESSSDAASLNDSDVEELPRVPVVGLNGDGLVDHMAKDDLLDDSDTSSTHKDMKSSQEEKNDEESEEDNVKSKRRKANTISSDSEAGSSRKKDPKRSDFEDSEEDGSEPVKKNKRKKLALASDSESVTSSTEGKKKRRRIKNVDDSEGSGSDSENEGKNKHGRKNIRKVMGKNQLEEATKRAAREEKERIARIAERQKLYNNLQFDESGKPDEVVLDKVVLDFDPDTKEPLIEVDKGLVKKLKPHQANGIKFMWDACFESAKRIRKDKGSGCILAHCMGLGKTLQVVSLTHTLLIHSDLTSVNRVLVVCPLSTVLNWVNEFRMWLKHAENEFEVDVYELSRYKQNSERAFQLQQWFQHGGVCVLGYEMFRNLSADNSKKFKKKMLKNFQESLVDPGPDMVVCDEGHLLKNEKTSLSQAMNRVKTLRRIVLTGTPLQNNLKEYYCMVQFVKPNLLGKYNEYLNRFVNPITNGQYTDSTEHDIRIMKRRSHVLHKMLDGAVQRRDYGVLAPFLPPKHENVLFITLTEVQIKLYQHYLENYSRRPLAGKSSGFLFPDFQSLQRIWTHPLVLKYNSERYEILQQKKRDKEEEEDDESEGSLRDFIDDDNSSAEESSTEDSSDDMSDISDDSRKKSKKKKSTKKSKAKDRASTRRGTRANPVELDDDVQEVVEVKNENPTEWWMPLVTEQEIDDMRNSHKLILLFDILRQCEAIGDKLLVFSQSLYSLDLIEHFLSKVDDATQEGRVDEKLGGHIGTWSQGLDYFRLDGSTSCENRSIWCKNFNREDNPRARLFLISTRAGGLGINLVAANRVVIFDVSWNPSHDVQSIFRVYRFGQKKPCYVYRFLAMGTMEEKIYERQVTKQAISKRVIDEQQIDRHYAENDLAELYKFEPHPPQPRPIPPLPKDRLFAEMLKEHEQCIYKYHEHDSLLENKEEETLTEEERKAAWEDFENEKTRPPVPWVPPMVPHLLAQQQQQLAFAAVAAMLRKEMPNMSELQIREMLPIIYNSNPAFMQKLNDIYKYSQPGLMNPAMMNPVMNAGGGMGGSSGLQYEPPWQRQQQQQHQMRLQQLMQQQNQMGAKFYAGGLGSRDPVAMALQQQRAREMMSGESTRPRGRPPHAQLPTVPPDVVNLDSD